MKRKHVIPVVVALALVAILAIGTTLALLSATSNTKTNTFVAGEAEIELREPLWDDDPFTDETALGIDEEDLGETLAENIVPGDVIPKNPTVKNTGNVEVWIAVVLDYQVYDETEDDMVSIPKPTYLTPNFDTTNWIQDTNDANIYYYKYTVTADAKTTALFSNVTFALTAEEIADIDIVATAYAIQSKNVDAGTVGATAGNLPALFFDTFDAPFFDVT